MAHIDYYLGTISPFCYLAGDRLERIAQRHGASITYKPLDVLQLLDRTGGQRQAQRHPNRLAYRNQELIRWADYLQMPLNPRPAAFPVNSAPSSYAVIAAQAAGGGDLAGLVQSLLRAVWAEDLDISDDAVIRDRLAQNDFDPALVDKGLFIGAETYGRNLDQAVEAGAFGVPFYHVPATGQCFWGQDRLEFLDRHLAEA
ncbi:MULTISPECIES: 2-hydroxychromene-2-carboxylate isomerase [unclassified Paracoccus (in: a-proteobacteria)]|uniref:2-hydroxychromene-2-carboxylate isomerase n=1 Tax=unclassified Paracoccus (in: a-proteobacteria) TaxID=2688777 RepID=UPI0012B1B083|nr:MULTISPECIES: 2-hydroxychromene-2-carboxylate isomerase [unclassified Paracoccus (in: a-proteobacteria)]UXU74797.1 2-hydroxychromene-2-carboxylate isomerase [Paracoccus sp. SMMA_5]UXU80694.1 2-hydroxychromene-2-carboxylate isomerase [Paracoccus sp. SMMA_5_TC]